MTKEQAIEIRRRQLWGEPVHPQVLAEAIQTIQMTALSSARKPYKCRLPTISQDMREKVNAVLIEKFKRALGRDFTGMKQEGTL